MLALWPGAGGSPLVVETYGWDWGRVLVSEVPGPIFFW